MKRFHYLFPVLVLAVGLGWSVRRANQFATLEQEIVGLEARIHARSMQTVDGRQGDLSWFRDADDNSKKDDWAGIARAWENRKKGASAQTEFYDQFSLLSADELIEGLDMIESLGLDPEALAGLKLMLLNHLIQKDPAEAISRSDLSSESEESSYLVQMALQKWLEKDPAAALAWFEREESDNLLEDGKIDPQNSLEFRLKSNVLNHLLKSQPGDALERIRGLSHREFESMMTYLNLRDVADSAQQDLVSLIRERHPDSRGTQMIASMSQRMLDRAKDSENRFLPIENFMEAIEASPVERAEIVKSAAYVWDLVSSTQLLRQVEETRTWAASQSPGIEDEVAGQLLGMLAASTRIKHQQAIEQVEAYHEQSGNDAVIERFLKYSSSDLTDEQIEQSKVLAAKISDEEMRERILRRLQR